MFTSAGRLLILLAHAFVGWALCAASIGIGMAVTSEQNALLIHAIGAPIFFGLVSAFYFTRFGFTTPLQTATFFVSFVILVDFFVMSLIVLKSFEMFASLIGTWIPFMLIFAVTYLTGQQLRRKPQTSGVP